MGTGRTPRADEMGVGPSSYIPRRKNHTRSYTTQYERVREQEGAGRFGPTRRAQIDMKLNAEADDKIRNREGPMTRRGGRTFPSDEDNGEPGKHARPANTPVSPVRSSFGLNLVLSPSLLATETTRPRSRSNNKLALSSDRKFNPRRTFLYYFSAFNRPQRHKMKHEESLFVSRSCFSSIRLLSPNIFNALRRKSPTHRDAVTAHTVKAGKNFTSQALYNEFLPDLYQHATQLGYMRSWRRSAHFFLSSYLA